MKKNQAMKKADAAIKTYIKNQSKKGKGKK